MELENQLYVRSLNVSKDVLENIEENIKMLKGNKVIDENSKILEYLKDSQSGLDIEIEKYSKSDKHSYKRNATNVNHSLFMPEALKNLICKLSGYSRWSITEETVDNEKVKDAFVSRGVNVGDSELKCIIIRRAVKGLDGKGDSPKYDVYKKLYLSSSYFIDMSDVIFTRIFYTVHSLNDFYQYVNDEIIPFADNMKRSGQKLK